MHFPLTSLVMGEAAGEADFAIKLVDDTEDVDDEKAEDEGLNGVKTENEMVHDGFKVPVKKVTEELRFSRGKGSHGENVSEKRAWVVSPGQLLKYAVRLS
jgi:uridine kinase